MLGLGGNTLNKLPAEIGELKNLTDLDLGSIFTHETTNQLKELPDEIRQLKKLKSLYLIGNPIPKVEITKIKRLLPNCKIDF